MKPQSRMLTRLHRPVATAAEAPAAVRSAALDPQAAFDRQVALKQALDRTLSETRAARSKRGVPTRLERLRKKLASVGTEPPGVPNPGELAVRVVGSRGTRNARVLPLGGMRVELGLDGGGRTALAAVTDASGYARFAVPEGEEPESYELRALAPDGKPVAVRSGRWSAEKGQRLRLEVGAHRRHVGRVERRVGLERRHRVAQSAVHPRLGRVGAGPLLRGVGRHAGNDLVGIGEVLCVAERDVADHEGDHEPGEQQVRHRVSAPDPPKTATSTPMTMSARTTATAIFTLLHGR